MSPLAIFFLCFGFLYASQFVSALDSTCTIREPAIMYKFTYQCPLSISPYSPLQVDGNFLDSALSSKQRRSYTSVLFYASWCPFSLSMRHRFELLSSMFPQIEHLAVEQSSALPSVFSRYGIHSIPSVLLLDQRSRKRYYGPKNLQALVQFYVKTTGLEPVQCLTEYGDVNLDNEKTIMHPWDGSSLEDTVKRELYLMLVTLFLILRLLAFASTRVFSHLKAFFGSYIPHFNLQIFGKTSQLFGRVLHMIDVQRIWTKLTLCKNHSFHERAKNCRVWASSLASVSLGESSSQARL